MFSPLLQGFSSGYSGFKNYKTASGHSVDRNHFNASGMHDTL